MNFYLYKISVSLLNENSKRLCICICDRYISCNIFFQTAPEATVLSQNKGSKENKLFIFNLHRV